MNKTSGYDMRDTIDMAREAGGDDWGLFKDFMPEIERLVALVRADERSVEREQALLTATPLAAPVQEPIIKSYLGKDISASILPDHLTYDEPETREYINGWNDCRQAMIESLRKPT